MQRSHPLTVLTLALMFMNQGCEGDESRRLMPEAGLDAAMPGDAATPSDTGPRDAGQGDAAPDGGSLPRCKTFAMPDECVTAPMSALPRDLHCTGLYGDLETRTIACGIVAYSPAHPLWTDDAVKYRFVSLPAGTKIDVTDPDAFVYPVGTQFWKEFNIPDGKGGTRLGETRLLRKVEGGWIYGTYVWNEDGTNAVHEINGVANLFGLGHTVPTRDQCDQCHKGRADFVLGWDPIMLDEGAEGVTMASLQANDQLSTKAGAIPTLRIPGDAIEQAALGYLHANCGVSCHNRSVAATAQVSGLFLRLSADTLDSVSDTDAYEAINKLPGPNVPPAIMAPVSGAYLSIRPLDPERSLLLARMKLRGTGQMPLIGSNVVDPTGVGAIIAWIERMTQGAGYPAAAD